MTSFPLSPVERANSSSFAMLSQNSFLSEPPSYEANQVGNSGLSLLTFLGPVSAFLIQSIGLASSIQSEWGQYNGLTLRFSDRALTELPLFLSEPLSRVNLALSSFSLLRTSLSFLTTFVNIIDKKRDTP